MECADFIDCATCTQTPMDACVWANNACLRQRDLQGTPATATAPSQCPVPCEQRTTCGECFAHDNFSSEHLCSWCPSTQTCLSFGEYTMTHHLGECRAWYRFNDEPQCQPCAGPTHCTDCFMQAECGWCSPTSSPDDGFCTDGDYGGVWGNNGTCNVVEALVTNTTDGSGNASTVTEYVQVNGTWSYDLCPDKDECALGDARCGPNATCLNTYGSYACICQEGYAHGNSIIGGQVRSNQIAPPKKKKKGGGGGR